MNPLSYNMLSPLGFRLVTKRLPDVEFWCQKANLPGVSIPTITQPTPFQEIPLPGRPIVFQPLTVEFKVDEVMGNYFSVYDWMIQNAFPDSYDEYKYDDTTTDLILSVLGSNERPRTNIRFEGAFPIGLSGLQFSSTEQDVQYISATAQFAFLRYFHEAAS